MNRVLQVHIQPLTLSEATQQISADKATASRLMDPLILSKERKLCRTKNGSKL